MYTRSVQSLEQSFFLLGPRGTGKSTWLREEFIPSLGEPDPPFYDLLNTSEALRLSRNPSLVFDELAHLKPRSWVIFDEIQKVPPLLNEVHRLIEEKKLRFVLSGSSARKLRRSGENLLAGRAIIQSFFPLTSEETGHTRSWNDALRWGMLPMALTVKDPGAFLRTYAEVYLKEEVQAEALTRNIGGFARFLEIAARQNGQVTNVSGISRDAEVARQTAQGYFEILVDTLVGFWLPAWKLKNSTKQKRLPKFYFFDSGVVRSLAGRTAYPVTEEEKGALLETWVLHEVRSYLSYRGLAYPLYYWSSPNGIEVDLFLETSKGFVALEVKSSKRWDSRFGKGLNRIVDAIGSKSVRTYGIFLGERPMMTSNHSILPVGTFLKELWKGKIIA